MSVLRNLLMLKLLDPLELSSHNAVVRKQWQLHHNKSTVFLPLNFQCFMYRVRQTGSYLVCYSTWGINIAYTIIIFYVWLSLSCAKLRNAFLGSYVLVSLTLPQSIFMLVNLMCLKFTYIYRNVDLLSVFYSIVSLSCVKSLYLFLLQLDNAR